MEKLKGLQNLFPAIYNKSKETISYYITSVTISETQEIISTSNTENELIGLLNSKVELDEITALKYIIGFMLLGKDISKFTVRIIELYPRNILFIKKLCLHIIEHLSLKKRNELLLLHNSIVKGFSDPDILNRFFSVYVLVYLNNSTIREECFKLLLTFLNDSNPLIRRLSMIVLVYYIKEHNIVIGEELLKVVRNFLNDPHPLAFSSALFFLSELPDVNVDESLSIKLPYILENLYKIDEFYFERSLFVLTNFALRNLCVEKNQSYLKQFIKVIYNQVKNINNNYKSINLMNSLFYFTDNLSERKQQNCVKYLIRLLINSKKYEQLVILDLILKYIGKSKIIYENFQKHINYFGLKVSEKEHIHLKKLEIIIALTDINNIKEVLDDFKAYSSYPSYSINRMLVQAIYYISKKDKELANIAIEKLIDFLKIKDDHLVSQVIIILRKVIFEIKENTKYVLIYSLKHFTKNITSNLARANIIWMISQYIDVIPTVSLDFYRRIVKDIHNESDEVKSQSINFALKLYQILGNLYDSETVQRASIILNYHLDKLFYDKNYYIREKSRLVKVVLAHSKSQKDENMMKALEEIEKTQSVHRNSLDEPNKEESDNISNTHIMSTYYFANLKGSKFLIAETNTNSDECLLIDELIKSNLKDDKKASSYEPRKFVSLEGKEVQVSQSYKNTDTNIEEKKLKMKNEWDKFLEKSEDQFEAEIEPEN